MPAKEGVDETTPQIDNSNSENDANFKLSYDNREKDRQNHDSNETAKT